MSEVDRVLEGLLAQVRAQAQAENIRLTVHAHQEMVEKDFTLDDILAALASGQMLENYPEHRRGACCLIGGTSQQGRPLHIVCTTAGPVLIIITVCEPKLPRWVTPTTRGR